MDLVSMGGWMNCLLMSPGARVNGRKGLWMDICMNNLRLSLDTSVLVDRSVFVWSTLVPRYGWRGGIGSNGLLID